MKPSHTPQPHHPSRTKRNTAGPRGGTSLVEALIVSSLITVIASLGMSITYKLLIAKRHLHTELAWHNSLHRFGMQWRTDVHDARFARIDSGENNNHSNDRLVLTDVNGTDVFYRVVESGIETSVLREVHDGDILVQRDGFGFPPRTLVNWSIDERPHAMAVCEFAIPEQRFQAASAEPVKLIANLMKVPVHE